MSEDQAPGVDLNFSINLEDSMYDTSIASPNDDLSHTIVRSVTTDTLDSVALGPSPSEENLQILLEDVQENAPQHDHSVVSDDKYYLEQESGFNLQLDFNVPELPVNDCAPSSDDNVLVQSDIDAPELNDGEETDKLPSLQSYFSSTPVVDVFSESFFNDIPTPQNNDKDDTNVDDIYTSSEYFSSLDADRTEKPDSSLDYFDTFLSLNTEDVKEDTEITTTTDTDIQHEHHRQIRTISQTEVVDFDTDDNKLESQSYPVKTSLLTTKEFEHFTAQGDENEGLENLSVSPRLHVFIPPHTRQSPDTDSPLVTTGLPLSPVHTPAHTPLTPVTLRGDATNTSPQPPLTDSDNQRFSTSYQTQWSTTDQPQQTTTSFSPVPRPDPFNFMAISDKGSPTDLDPFTASIQSSDKQRQYDAWLPSETTKQHLVAMVTNLPSAYSVPQDQLCYAAVAVNDAQVDPVRELVDKYLGEAEANKRHILTIDSVSHDEDGLGRLIEAGCYWAAVDLTGRLLTQAGQGIDRVTDGYTHTPATLQDLMIRQMSILHHDSVRVDVSKLWLSRFNLHLQLHMYAVADTEMKGFHNLDSPDLYYDFYPTIYPGRRGTLVPFSLRLIHAELPHYMGRTQEALDRLYYILSIVNLILGHLREGRAEDGSELEMSADSRQASTEVWQSREVKTLYIIANTLLSIKDFTAAISVYEQLLLKDTAHRCDLHSGIGRVYLQMGNAGMAKESFDAATTDKGNTTEVTQLINQGLLSMCEGHYPDAWQAFSKAVATNPLNLVAINNLSVCALYMGRLSEALVTLENLVHQKPSSNLHEGILFNLCTLYELESSRAMAKKQALLELVARYRGDGFSVACLKMA